MFEVTFENERIEINNWLVGELERIESLGLNSYDLSAERFFAGQEHEDRHGSLSALEEAAREGTKFYLNPQKPWLLYCMTKGFMSCGFKDVDDARYGEGAWGIRLIDAGPRHEIGSLIEIDPTIGEAHEALESTKGVTAGALAPSPLQEAVNMQAVLRGGGGMRGF